MPTRLLACLAIACATIAFPAAAHHSFAVWDMSKSIEFEGVVETVKLRNPHMAMTLVQTKPDGTKETINFTEGAPANMMVRMGLKPEDIAAGTKIKAIGAPRRDNAAEYFLKAIILPDGTKITAVP
jgi:Family of unknown function (DUF6152)